MGGYESPEKVAVRTRRWYLANREKTIARAAAWHEENHDAWAKTQKRWRQNNPEARVAHDHRRRARVMGNEGTHTKDDVLAQKARQRDRCYWCHKPLEKYHVDHVTPLVLGGSNGPENLVISCPPCNQSKGAKHPMEFAGVML